MRRAKAPAIQLPADRVDAWRLERQLLVPATRAPDPATVARTLLGVQAQVMSAAALSIALRSGPGGTVATTAALNERRLVRSWAMRGTLHLFAADDFPTFVGALRYRENWRSTAWLRYFEVTEPQMEAIIEAIGVVLDDGVPRSRVALADALVARLGHDLEKQLRSSWGTFLKPAANRGLLVQAPTDGTTVAYVRPDRWLGSWRVVDPDVALADIVERYLGAYGPATLQELSRWWGGANAKLRKVIHDLGDRVVEVEVEGARSLLLAADVEAIENVAPNGDAVQLLGAFDPLIVGGGQRARLIPAAYLTRVSRIAGWISPVVLIGGRVGGVWTSSQKGRGLHLTVDLFERSNASLRRRIANAADEVAAALATTATVAYGPVFAAPTDGAAD